ncbi:MAG: peptide-methionine (S)-S-oxide reductase MsrA [Moraxellaceae bacterium]|nr:peptide-methionine (S)-S-oxide reductase MsrA [Moraxellaceae bacterium]
MQKALLGGGCFWCLDAVFREVNGVTSVVSGYAGGARPNPTYEQICTGATGHAEVVELTFDGDLISFRELLGIFFAIHDPTTLNRQGNDIGTQYRSVIFYGDAEQEEIAREVVAALESGRIFAAPVVTEISPAPVFWPAEAYHQNYFALHPAQGYCQIVIAPKLAKFRQKFLR